jgi:hypothetical protein
MTESPAMTSGGRHAHLALLTVVLGGAMLTLWIMALALSVWWEPELFDSFWLEVVVVEISLAFLVGALTARYWRSLAGGLAVACVATAALWVCSTRAHSVSDPLFWDDKGEWKLIAFANLMFLGLPLACVASVGTLLNRRSIPRPALRYGLPVGLMAIAVLTSMTRAGAWDFERDTYSEVVIQVIDTDGRPLDDVCFKFEPIYQRSDHTLEVRCTGAHGIPGQISVTSADSNDHDYYRLRGESKPAECRAKHRAAVEFSVGDPGSRKKTLIYECGAQPLPSPAPANPVAGDPF